MDCNECRFLEDCIRRKMVEYDKGWKKRFKTICRMAKALVTN